MTIAEWGQKCKYYLNEYLYEEVFFVALIILVGMGGFGLGRLSLIAEERAPVTIQDALSTATASADEREGAAAAGAYVASKNGTKYHLPWCPGAGRINEENKMWFSSKEEAESAGYAPAANCPGI